jgi:hypothetical protein
LANETLVRVNVPIFQNALCIFYFILFSPMIPNIMGNFKKLKIKKYIYIFHGTFVWVLLGHYPNTSFGQMDGCKITLP